MSWLPNKSVKSKVSAFLRALLRDRSGNALIIVAGALVPLLAMVGGGIDMGRSYLAESRLQRACDSGVLAARKKLGSSAVLNGLVPAAVATSGEKFFNINYREGSYGTANRTFVMTLEADYSISGVATVKVPTTVMRLFAFNEVPVRVTCEAKLNFSNTDVMMVLDTTGSMNEINSGDTQSRITVMKNVVSTFHATMEASKGPGIRLRYGFVPYSTNVNVGALLQNDWVVSNWTYQSREVNNTVTTPGTTSYNENWTYISGGNTQATGTSYAATWVPPVPPSGGGNEIGGGSGGSPGYYTCTGSVPSNTSNGNYVLISTNSVPYTGPPVGTKVIQHYSVTYTGTYYWVSLSGTTCTNFSVTYNNEKYEYDYVTIPTENTNTFYRYAPISRSVVNWRTETAGCMEERGTYAITDYNNVNFAQALDLDIDTVPTAGVAATQWRPMYPNIIYERELDDYDDNDDFTVAEVIDDETFFRPTQISSLVACPTVSKKLAEMTAAEVTSYLGSITASGTTYHDIGMIWGGRLLSPSGLFAADNVDVVGKPTKRHLIFLTDGQTETYDIAYGAYGIEPLDRRRWVDGSGSEPSLNATVEKRFAVACEQVKNRNITVWVIGFGTSVSNVMQTCAGSGRWFEASDAATLTAAFTKIAASMGDLRISK